MPFTSKDRSAFAESVPVYAESAPDGTWRVVDTATGEVVSSEHASARQALTSSAQLMGKAKGANLRTDGEPDGEWRWLDATAVEDAPIGGVRIGERAIWEMAASLNNRGSAVPINGGGPVAGLGDSVPHGDAMFGGDHLANGYAHVGGVVLPSDGRAHLYLWSELLPEIARETDRGRLAYGSVHFSFEAVDEADNFAASGAGLISHALTNDPAVTTLTAGSERYRAPGHTNVMRARRSAWRENMPDETIESTASATEAPDTTEREPEAPAERAEGDMPEPSPMEASFAAALGQIFGKPDASPADLLAELEARAEEIAGALAESESDPNEEAEMEAKPEGEDEEEPQEMAASADLRSARDEARAEAANLRKRVDYFEARDWLDAELAKRGKALPKDKRERWTKIAVSNREMVTELLETLSAPPVGNPMLDADEQVRSAEPQTQSDAFDACEDDAREALERTEKRNAARTGRAPRTIERHVIRAAAQDLARERFPHLFNSAA